MVKQALQDPPIKIMVCDPMTKDAGLSKHTIYNVKGMDNLGQFDIYRRYNDFYALRDYLVIKWPGCYIPPIPVCFTKLNFFQSKEFAGGNDDQVVHERKR